MPAASVALQVNVVWPSANVEPEGGLQVAVTGPSTTSLAAGVAKVTTAPAGPVASTDATVGVSTLGGVVSWTVTLKPPVAMLPAVSAAEQDTAVVPSGNVLPDDGRQVTVGLAGLASVAVAT